MNVELTKCCTGFKGSKYMKETYESKRSVAAAEWGCGSKNGDPQLKFIIQWLASSYMGRPFKYYGPLDGKMELTK